MEQFSVFGVDLVAGEIDFFFRVSQLKPHGLQGEDWHDLKLTVEHPWQLPCFFSRG